LFVAFRCFTFMNRENGGGDDDDDDDDDDFCAVSLSTEYIMFIH